MIVCEAIMNKIEDFKQNSLKRILYSQTLGEPRYYFIIEGKQLLHVYYQLLPNHFLSK